MIFRSSSSWTFRPRKKEYLAPPSPKILQFAAEPAPPSQRLGLPLPLPPGRKIKNIRPPSLWNGFQIIFEMIFVKFGLLWSSCRAHMWQQNAHAEDTKAKSCCPIWRILWPQCWKLPACNQASLLTDVLGWFFPCRGPYSMFCQGFVACVCVCFLLTVEVFCLQSETWALFRPTFRVKYWDRF